MRDLKFEEWIKTPNGRAYQNSKSKGGQMGKLPTIAELKKQMEQMEEKLVDIKLSRMGVSIDSSTPGQISIIRNNYGRK